MSLVAVIAREPRLDLEEWIHWVATDAELVRSSPRMITNPFKNTRYLWAPRDDEVEIRVEGVTVGGIEASPEFADDGELHVYSAEPYNQSLRKVVSRIAAQLSATVTWLQD